LAQARVGGDKDTAVLARDFGNVDQSAWPAAVFALYLGKGTPDAVRVAAAAGDPAGKADRECEAAFYLGEFALLNGKRDEASPLLQDAGDKCPVGFTERYAARGELGRLP
jgi:lipoprotein NlpI